MKHTKHLTSIAVLMLSAGLCAAPAFAQATKEKGQPDKANPGKPEKAAEPGKPADKGQDPAKGKPEKAAEPGKPDEKGNDPMAAWSAANKINDNHIALAGKMSGKWSTTTSFWMEPGGEAQKSAGKAEFKADMGGRFITCEYQGEMMGKPFRGLNWIGYSNQAKKYVSAWIDSETTDIFISHGDKDADGNIVWLSEAVDPITGEKKTIKSMNRFPDKNSMTFEMYEPGPDGKEFKSMEILYTRGGGKPEDAKKPANPSTSPETNPPKDTSGQGKK
jgi:hypothetical protein